MIFRVVSFCLLLFMSIGGGVLHAQKPSNEVDSLKKCLLSISDTKDQVDVLVRLSKKIKCTNAEEKLRYALLAKELAKKKGSQEQVFLTLSNLGETYRFCNQEYDKAITVFNEYIKVSKELKDTTNESLAFYGLGRCYELQNNYALAIKYWKISIDLHPDIEQEATIWGNMGSMYAKLADNTKALQSYTTSLSLVERNMRTKNVPEIRDSFQVSGLLLTISDIYISMNEYEKALENADNALVFGSGNSYLKTLAYMSMGKSYEFLLNYGKAKRYYEQALELSQTTNGINEVTILRYLAEIYLLEHNNDLAMQYAERSLAIAERMNNEYELPITYVTLAKIHTTLRAYDKAVLFLKKAIDIAQKTHALDNEEEAWEQLHTTYEAMKKPAEALAAYKQFISLRDSLFNIDNARELTRIDLESRYSQLMIIDSIDNLKKTTELNLMVQKQRILSISGYIGIGLVLLLSFFIYRNYSQQKKANFVITTANEDLQEANKVISEEKEISEQLLLNILPEEVATELKRDGNVRAKQFDEVSVLFTDFIDFTKAGELFSPQELVAELHSCFKAFDVITSKYQIEKIKTVGDAYMAVSGLPQANPNHAVEMVSAALDMQAFMAARRKAMGEKTFEVRIGINSGSVVAGIVGVKKFAYDIWGDTVNIAARMEQNSEAGKINISEATYELVKDSFSCEYRGEIDAKGKGMLNMYYVSA